MDDRFSNDHLAPKHVTNNRTSAAPVRLFIAETKNKLHTRIRVMGFVVCAKSPQRITLDDGTGVIHAYITSGTFGKKSNFRIGQILDCVGIIQDNDNIHIDYLSEITDPNEEKLRNLEIMNMNFNNYSPNAAGMVMAISPPSSFFTNDHGMIAIQKSVAFRLIKSCSSDGGLLEEDLALILGCGDQKDDKDIVRNVLLELQTGGEIYKDMAGAYRAL